MDMGMNMMAGVMVGMMSAAAAAAAVVVLERM